jgi:hypothetical protein
VNVYAVVREFQTLIVGALGFMGVIFTLWFNAYQVRQQREGERSHERETLRAALIEELKIIQGSISRNIADWDGNTETSAYVPIHTMDDAYRAFTNRIGLLSSEEVRRVMNAYLTMRTFHSKLFLIGTPADKDALNVLVPAKNVSWLNEMYKNLLLPIAEAISSLEKAKSVR